MKNLKIIRAILAFCLFLFLAFVNIPNLYIKMGLYLLTYLIAGYDVFYKAIRNIFMGVSLDENFLMSIASIGAFCIGEFSEGAAVIIFYQIGEIFQEKAVDHSRKQIAALMNIRPDIAYFKTADGIKKVAAKTLQKGDVIVIRPGDRVPLDCKIIEGNSFLDTSALTGESLPRRVNVGDVILSGSINTNNPITAVVEKEYNLSTASLIIDMVENAYARKSKSERFITKFARFYTPIVVITAAVLAFIPPIFLGFSQFSNWLYRALIFLVISCPCALVISVPLSFFAGIGKASKSGILVKGGNYLETLAKLNTVVFDKTGTLTKGVFSVQSLKAINCSEEELLNLAAAGEKLSSHPIAKAISEKAGETPYKATDIEEMAGLGIKAKIDEKVLLIGNSSLLAKYNIDITETEDGVAVIYVAFNEQYLGYIVIEDVIKPNAFETINQLNKKGIKTVMLTGDSKSSALKIANSLNIAKTKYELLPQDKVKLIETLLNKNGSTVFVGDGINDAPVIARADVGIAMGALGSDAAIEAADMVIMNDDPQKIISAVNISKKTVKIAKQNIVFALAVKGIVLVLGALGLAVMWEAVFADIGVMVLCVLNSLRAFKN